MAKHIRWAHPFKTREIHGLVFEPGQVHVVEDDMVALDILTQPGEPFEEADPEQTIRVDEAGADEAGKEASKKAGRQARDG